MATSRKRKRGGKPVRYNPGKTPDVIAERRENLNEQALQRQWRLDPSAGRKIPEAYDYVEDRPEDDSPLSRTERRFLTVISESETDG